MASAAERFHIVLSPDERRAWKSGAARHGIATAEYVRRAVVAFETGLSADELEELGQLADAAQQASQRMAAMIDRTIAILDRPLDDAAVRARVEAELAADPVLIDPRQLDFTAAPLAR